VEITIQSIHFTADAKLVEYITNKVSKLSVYSNKILSAQVYLKLENGDAPVKDKVVEIKLKLPSHTLFAEDTSKKYEDSIDIVVEHLRKQLLKYKEKINTK
jgi:putative sigma-54 modulation protein